MGITVLILACIIVFYVLIKLTVIIIAFLHNRDKGNKTNILYRSIEPFKDKSQFYFIPTLKYTKGDFVEFNFLWGIWGVYVCYKFLTDDEDIAITETLLKV